MRLAEATALLVDDETELLEIFSAWLQREGCKVLTASNGAEALHVLDDEKIDIVVSDVRMPVINGIELVRTINGMRMALPSIIFVSGYADINPREMYGLGVEKLIEKPTDRKHLKEAVEESLMELEERWLTPHTNPIDQILTMEIDSLAAAIQSCRFQLGRGGCCFSTDQPLTVEKTIDVSLQLASEGLSFKAQGIVRWFDAETSRTGISFDYLHPESREWVIRAIRDAPNHSFIPQCHA